MAQSPIDDATVRARVLEILGEVTENPAVGTRPDLPLYRSGLLDSLGTVTLMVAFGDAFGLEISPADFDAEAWATPRQVVDDVLRRLAAERS